MRGLNRFSEKDGIFWPFGVYNDEMKEVCLWRSMHMDAKDAKDILEKIHAGAVASTQWRKVCGQEFTYEEAVDAADTSDIVRNMHLPTDELILIWTEGGGVDELVTGVRLFIAFVLPVEDAGKLLLNEADPRIIAVLRARCDVDNRGGRTILLPGEEHQYVE
jgi:hypothetical protein